jgi:hypothetical protein
MQKLWPFWLTLNGSAVMEILVMITAALLAVITMHVMSHTKP